eukprot:gene28441-37545_t
MSTNVLLGFVNIDLATKLPWNTEEYKPPRQHEIMENNMKARNTREIKKRDSKTEEKEGDLAQSEVPDSGLGVFPAKFNQSGEGTGVEMPSIFDEEETEERDKRALTNSLGQSRSGRLRNQDQDFDKLDLSHSTGPKSGENSFDMGKCGLFERHTPSRTTNWCADTSHSTSSENE